jgi:hypothetical protein
MDTDIYRRLRDEVKRDIDAATKERDRLRTQLLAEEQRLAGLLKLDLSISAVLSEEPADRGAPHIPTSVVQPHANGARREAHADVAERVLRAAGREMKTMEIVAEMLILGHPLPDDPRQREGAVYSAMLRRHNTFKNIGRGTWTVKDSAKPLSQETAPSAGKARTGPELSALHALVRSDLPLTAKGIRKSKH